MYNFQKTFQNKNRFFVDQVESLYQRLNSTRSVQRSNTNNKSSTNIPDTTQIQKPKRTKSCHVLQYTIEPPANTGKFAANKRKEKGELIVQWIKSSNPDSLDILRKIGETSAPYHNILQLICQELETIPVSQRNENSNDKAQQEIQSLKMEQNSLGLSLGALEAQRDRLEKEVQELESQYAALSEEANQYNEIISQLSFNTHEDFQMIQLNEEFQKIKEEKVLKSSLNSKRTDMMGQNHHLWDEKKRLIERIEEERAQQLQNIHQKAVQQLLKKDPNNPSNKNKKEEEEEEEDSF